MNKKKILEKIKKINVMCIAPLGNNKVVELISKEDVINVIAKIL